MIFEIAEEWTGNVPGTARMLIGSELETWKYLAPEAEEAPGTIEKDGESLSSDEIQVFDLPGFRDERVHIAVKLPSRMESVIGTPQQKAPAEAKPLPKPEPAPQPAESAPVESEKPWLSREAAPAPQAMPRLSALDQKLAAQSGLAACRKSSKKNGAIPAWTSWATPFRQMPWVIPWKARWSRL